MDFLNKATLIKEEIINWRRDLHKIPEVGLILPETAAYIKGKLDEMGIEYQTFENHSGIVALIGKEKNGKTIALRADMDGLKIKEEVDIPYASTNDNMHACGHDAHTAILLGAAKLLKENEEMLTGRVKLIFQPGEEGPGGAELMVKDGVLQNPEVDRILALHVGTIVPGAKSGTISLSYSNMFAADDQFCIKIKGVGGHGSMPNYTIDPVAIAVQVINSLQYIVSREVSALDSAVITVASMVAGRETYNIIPESAEIRGTIRTLKPEIREFVFKRMEDITLGVSKTMRGEAEIEFLDGYPALINSKECTQEFIESAKKIIKEEDIIVLDKSFMGGEDAAFFFREVPGTYFVLNTPKEENGVIYPHHNPKFQIDESPLHLGTALLVQAAVDFLMNNC